MCYGEASQDVERPVTSGFPTEGLACAPEERSERAADARRHQAVGCVPCFYPIPAGEVAPVTVPCRRCIGCRLEHSRQWAVRMMHEAQMHEASCFLTLTYDDDHVPVDGGLDREAMPLFMKRLRKSLSPLRVRFFQCGEYGDETLRPHHHVALFGTGFDDRYRWSGSDDHPVYRSELLEKAWPMGSSSIGALTFESAAYVARYVTKKISLSEYSDERARARFEARYERLNPLTGELVTVDPEFATMSRRPGIGRSWIERYWREVYPLDEVIVNGRPAKPPRYYDEWLAENHPLLHEEVMHKRFLGRRPEDETPARLRVREVCTEARLSLQQMRKQI